MSRIALGLEYDGSCFSGWQTQAHAASVQAAVQQALSFVANHPVAVTAAGRTDAGVHAAMQVVHFDTEVTRSARSWVLGANSNLPASVSALWAQPVPDTFHARYSAKARSYRYFILNRGTRAALARHHVCWIKEALDHEHMHMAAQVLLGEHDFTSFRAAECQSRTPMRRMLAISVQRRGELLELAVTANAFLHHMVRNIAGVLIAVGQGKQPPGWVAQVLAARDRTRAGITAPAEGLYLAAVRYDPSLQLPSEARSTIAGDCPFSGTVPAP
jgi:tRNA pseudouridine38-40 synthase